MNLILNYLRSIKKLCLESSGQISNGIKSVISESILIFKKSQNIKQTNIDLARFHFLNGNISDSIFRLIIIDKFISKNDVEVKNLLGLAYYAKGKIDKAIIYFSFDKSSNEEILDFLKDSSNYNEIPAKIYLRTRDNSALYYDILFTEKSYIPFLMKSKDLNLEFTQYILLSIPSLENVGEVLDLGCANGLTAANLQNQSKVKLDKIIGVEASSKMLEVALQNNPNLYTQTYNQDLNDFIKSHQNKYDLVMSFCSLDNTKDLTDIFINISKVLKTQGFFCIALKTSPSNTKIDDTKTCFLYNTSDLDHIIEASGLLQKNNKQIVFNEKNYIFIVLTI